MLISFGDLVKKYRISGGKILHVGAHKCEERINYKRYGWDDSSVIWIEGNPELCEEVKKANPSINIHQGLIADKDIVDLIVTNNTKASSIFEIDEYKKEHPWVFETKRMKLPTTKVSDVLKKTGIETEDIMFARIDIQGAELIALKSMEEYIPSIKYLCVNIYITRMFDGCPIIDEVDAYLYRLGFRRQEVVLSTHGWGDALYINENPKVTAVLRGGLGNRLFILAALMGYSYKNSEYKPVITDKHTEPFYQPNQRVNPSAFFRGIHTEPDIPIERIFVEPNGYSYDYKDINQGMKVKGNLLLDGYFQNEKYFEGIETWIESQYKCPFDIQLVIERTHPYIEKGAFIHVRRTDTLHLPYPDITSFYNDCIVKFPADTIFFMCSDDIQWCKSNMRISNVVFIEEDAIPTMWIMSLCRRGGIMGISTFSWWAGWLNKRRFKTSTIYSPLTRFNPPCSLFEMIPV